MKLGRAGRVLALIAVVSLAAALATGCGPRVPNVVGQTADEAVRTLQSDGYLLGQTRRMYTSNATAGVVFEQSPAAGTVLREGKPVDITVALPLGNIVVPDVTKLSADAASRAIAAAQLVPLQVDQYSDSVPKGSIGGQVPEPGAKVDAGSTVVYVVSKGTAPEKVKVPDVTGKKQSDADSAIKKAGLKPAAQKAYSDTVAKDIVILQNPAAGASVSPNSTVSYVVSLGKPPSGTVSVPNVVGKKEADAKSAIQSAGLTAQTYYQSDPKVAKGVVINQMPPAGSKTAKGGVVGILVSTGSETSVTVPDVTGKNADDAKSAIEAAGLTAYPVDQPSSTVDKGVVIQQLPVSGSTVPIGSAVLYVVSSGTPQ